jgi:hypothetical protein
MQGRLDGGEDPLDKVNAAAPAPLRRQFRPQEVYGIDELHKCGQCDKTRIYRRGRHYFKCAIMKPVHSENGDIKLKDPACCKFGQRIGKIPEYRGQEKGDWREFL